MMLNVKKAAKIVVSAQDSRSQYYVVRVQKLTKCSVKTCTIISCGCSKVGLERKEVETLKPYCCLKIKILQN